MFIKVTKSKNRTYYHLTESYRQNGKVRHRHLMSLGTNKDKKLSQLAEAVARYKKLLTLTQWEKEVSVEKTFILGPLLVLKKLFSDWGIDKILKDISSSHPKLSFSLRDLVFTQVALRFIESSSKLKIYDYWREKLYPEMFLKDIQLQHLYRSLDLLAQHKDEIEKKLYWFKKDKLQKKTEVVLYDLTTLRFESTRTDLGSLRLFGYSKEMRSDCTQVVFGLLLSPDGVPLGFEVYPGNTFEGKTLKSISEKMRKKLQMKRFIFVADRGLFSKKNLKDLEESKNEFIVGMKLNSFKGKTSEQIYDFHRMNFISKDLAFYEDHQEGRRIIVTWSRKREERDRRTRQDIIDRIQSKLSQKKVQWKAFVSHKGYKKYLSFSDSSQTPQLNQDFIEKEKQKDGFFAITSNVKNMKAQELILKYRSLWKIEDAFGEFKGFLKTRPIFHYKDRRILGHLVVCFLAYFCEAHMRERLRDQKIFLETPSTEAKQISRRPLTVVEAMKELKGLQALPLKIQNKVLWTRTEVTDKVKAIFKAMKIELPPRTLKKQAL